MSGAHISPEGHRRRALYQRLRGERRIANNRLRVAKILQGGAWISTEEIRVEAGGEIRYQHICAALRSLVADGYVERMRAKNSVLWRIV